MKKNCVQQGFCNSGAKLRSLAVVLRFNFCAKLKICASIAPPSQSPETLSAILTERTEVKTLNIRILNIEIRKINKDEYELVADMFDKYRIFYKQPSDIELAKQYLKNRLANNEAQILVAFDSITSELLGFTLLYARFSSVSAIKNWHIGDLYVEPNQRKRGIGQKLLQSAIDYATEHKAKFISLNTAKDNFTAQKVYEDFGFDKREYLPEYLYYQFDL